MCKRHDINPFSLQTMELPGSVMPDWTEESKAALVLSLLPPRYHPALVESVRELGSCRRASEQVPVSIPENVHRGAEAEWHSCREKGIAVVALTSPAYPRPLKEIADPPLVLYVSGRLEPGDEVSLAVVGSRRASAYGVTVCDQLARDLAHRGVTIVSGLARGIDTVAHRAALDAGGRTIAVLGSGLDRVYPSEHQSLAARIARGGAVLSEFALGTPPLAGHFPRRNRVITGLSLGVLVVEAAERSGSLISARHAGEQGREVFAVPGPLGAPGSAGCHQLIQDGAKLVTSVDDIIEELRPDLRDRLRSSDLALRRSAEPDLVPRPGTTPIGPSGGTREEPEMLTSDERRLLEALRTGGPADGDELVARTGLPVERVLAAIGALETKGQVRVFPGGLFRAAGLC